MKSKQKWLRVIITSVISLAIIIATLVAVNTMWVAEFEPALRIAELTEVENARISEALDEILQYNLEDINALDLSSALIREDTYTENSTDGVYQAIFTIDLPNIMQSYRINYYYLTPYQEQFFNRTTIASCLPEEELIYGDFDCKGDRQTAFIDRWHEIASDLAVKYGIPWETVVAQGILESAAGTSTYATERNNFFGIAAYDHNPDAAYYFDTPEEGWEGYFRNIVNTIVYCQAGVFRGDTITDPYAYLRAIKSANYATDPNYIESTSEIIRAVEARAAKKSWLTSAQLAELHPEMLTHAASHACR